MTVRDPAEHRAISASDERFREDLLQKFFEFRKDARLHLRSMDSGLSICRGEANALSANIYVNDALDMLIASDPDRLPHHLDRTHDLPDHC